ncbi:MULTISPECIES: hypothetical protein [unclassified Brevundimonas]|uniref:hypothetical protein n=1 Tax=unclassified Brevundimonas TaxID=2622653 RepID=UPI0025C08665|nr:MULTISPECIES: hypothetical protein [unclassified Brevundimonas]
MQMVVPSDLEERAAGLIGRPFLPKGDTPDGWDCRGLARWCLREWCDVAVPDYLDLYAAGIVSPGGRRERARLLAEGLGATWRPVEAQAGAVALLSWLGQSGHVGFMLSQTRILHADIRVGTATFDLTDPAAAYRLKGAFVPAFVTDIRHA